MAACMHALQPFSSGLGGDCFALYYNAQEKQVHCVDGSGSSPAALTLELAESRYLHQKQMYGLQATVPGAAKAWHHIITHFGSTKARLTPAFPEFRNSIIYLLCSTINAFTKVFLPGDLLSRKAQQNPAAKSGYRDIECSVHVFEAAILE
ncbi:hypothetical protein MRX96_016510 [Rhipicephalus microplus]